MASPKDEVLFQNAVSLFLEKLGAKNDDEFQQDFVKLSVLALIGEDSHENEEARKTLVDSLSSTLPELERLSHAQRAVTVSHLIDAFVSIRRGKHKSQGPVTGGVRFEYL